VFLSILHQVVFVFKRNAIIVGRRYGQKRIPFHSPKGFLGGPRKPFGGKGIIGHKKRIGFLDGFRKRGFLGGSKKGFNKGIIKDKGLIPPIAKIPIKPDIIPGGILPGKSGIIPGGLIPGKYDIIPGGKGIIPGKSGILPGGIFPGKPDIFPGGILPGKPDIFPGGILPGKPDIIPGIPDIIPGGILPGKYDIPGKSGILPGKPDIIPGKDILPGGILPGKPDIVPGKDILPGGTLPVSPDIIPGIPGIIPDEILPGIPDIVPGKAGIIPGKPDIIPGKNDIIPGGVLPGKPGILPGKTDILPGGILPGKPDIIPGKPDIVPGKTGIIPDKTGVIDGCPPRPCLQTQEFIPQDCRRPQFFLHNGRQCPDCDIDICIGGSVLPDTRGVWGSDLGPRGSVGPIGPGGSLPGDLDWQGDLGRRFPRITPGINTQIGGGLFPDPLFPGQFGRNPFNRRLSDVDRFDLQNRGPFDPRFGGFDQTGVQFGPVPSAARAGLVNRLNAGFDFDPSWNTGNVGDFGASWRDNRLPTNSLSNSI
jgi:hypothetical protein